VNPRPSKLSVGTVLNTKDNLSFGGVLETRTLPSFHLIDVRAKRSLALTVMQSDVIGRMLGHCRVVAKIGEGGMGAVYRAYDEVLHRDVAVKVVRKGSQMDSSASKSLLQEARASSALGHPNICTIYEVGETEGELYIVMELLDGKTLREMCGELGLPPESVLRYGAQIASALARAHDRGIIHRDLKTANIVITSDGLAKVLDFGLAKRLGGGLFEGPTRSLASLEEVSGVSGTLPYMAPETLRGEQADHRSDLWALGVVLYEAACGHLPFQGRTGFEISSAIMREMPAVLGPPVPPGLWAIIQRCLAKEPAQRYQRAGEIQAALEAVQSAAIVSASPSPDPGGPPRTVLHSVHHAPVKKGDFLLLVGTTKGAFILRSNAQRRRWKVGGPYFHGHNVYALAYDSRDGRHRIWASTQSYWGTFLRSSDDFGKSWTNPQQAPIRFPADTGVSLKNIWQIIVGPREQPDVLYCGVEPAALFESVDAGETWAMNRALFDHPHRPRWMPSNGGLALHTIVLDPSNDRRMYIAISSGGVYRTDDGGQTWRARNSGVRATFMPNHYPEFGQCVHKITMDPARPERLFLQNHWGVYRSDDCAESWTDIANGIPSDFGFAILVHPARPDWVYVIPVESDEFRCACEGRLRVYRSRNAGASWEALMRGLPQKGAYETVLRDGLVSDALDPVGLYFGTRSGQLFASLDEGRSWEKVVEGFPSIVCVRTAVIGEASREPGPGQSQPISSASRPEIESKSSRSSSVRKKG
jgi:serine/threonine protein kinase